MRPLAFYDIGWAGSRAAWNAGNRISGAGVGLSILEGLLRERPLAPDQQLEPGGDNGFVLRASVADTMRLRWWLLGFGDRITVLGPDRLREEMAATVRRMAAVYAGDAARDSMETSRTPATDMAVSAARNVQTAAHR